MPEARRGLPIRLILVTVLLWLGVAFAVSGQEVTLPLSVYEALLERAELPVALPAKPASPFAIEHADLAVVVGEQSARVEATLQVVLLEDGWQVLPLAHSGQLIEVDFGDLEGRVRSEDGSLVVRGAGRHRIQLRSALALDSDDRGTVRSVRLKMSAPPAGTVTGEIRYGADFSRVEVLAGGLLTEEAVAGTVGFVAQPGMLFVARLEAAGRGPVRDELPLEWDSTVVTQSVLRRTRHSIDSRIGVRIRQGEMERVEVELPEGLEVVTVESERLAGWDVAGTTLSCLLLGPTERDFSIRVLLSGPPARGSDELSSVVLQTPAAHRTTHFSSVRLEGDGLLTLAEIHSARGLEAAEQDLLRSLGQDPRGMLRIADGARPPIWSVDWSEGVEVLAAKVDRMLLDVLVGSDGTAAFQLWLRVSNRGAQQLRLDLPQGFELVDVARGRRRIRAGEAGSSLVLPLVADGSADLFRLSGLMPIQAPSGNGTFQLDLPGFSAPVNRVEVRLLLPGGAEYRLQDPSRGGALGAVPSPASSTGDPVLTRPTSRGQLAGIRAAPEVAPAALFARPPGYSELHGAWNALSPSPRPLIVEVTAQRSDRRWF